MAARVSSPWGVPAPAPPPAGPAHDLPDLLGPTERRLLDRGKKEHRKTTETARRALQVAEQAAEIGRCTVVEAHRQGQALTRTEDAVWGLEQDVREASLLVKFLRRCRKQQLAEGAAASRAALEAKQADVERARRPAAAALDGDVPAARAELFRAGDAARARPPPPTALGYGLAAGERLELAEETAAQDGYLDRIGVAVSQIREMGLDLREELEAQAPQIDALAERTATAQGTLGALRRAARKV